ncbi:T9SS type A sorting domain-containing protein [Hymenobacter sp.]|uniref:T9SS type A sorting domain-containing protein n=1 Tax=Hymenobacter sp. TaxID=1898978 RepID=UPI002ED7B770
MKISTRIVGLLGLLLIQLSALAATVTVEVGDNFYRPQNVVIQPGDVIRWVNIGLNSHPTVSDSSPMLWPTFTISPTNTMYTSQPLTALGTFNYYCSLHSFSTPRQGMIGSITVSNTPQSTLSSKAAGIALSVYPNPSKGLVVVTLNQKVDSNYKLRLTNVLGREIRSFSLRTEASNTGMPLNLSDLPAGMYFYSLVQNDKVLSTKRFVLQN